MKSTEASTIAAAARSVASRRASCIGRSSIAYPERQSSGNTATATDLWWHTLAASNIAPALLVGSATLETIVQAATRANP
jgi:hypothetical protein